MQKNSFVIICALVCSLSYADGMTEKLALDKSVSQEIMVTKPLNIKVVNGFEVAGNTKKGSEIKDGFMKEKNRAESEIRTEQQKIIKATEEFKAKASTLNEDARRKEERAIAKMNEDLKRRSGELQEELQAKMYKDTEELGLEFEAVVREYGKKGNIDLVIDASSGRPVFVADRLSCTDDIVKLMDISYEKGNKVVATQSKGATIKKDQKTTVATQAKASAVKKDQKA